MASSSDEARRSAPAFQSLRTRGWIVACFYLIVLASLPIWLQTTSIERLSLPRAQIKAWEARLPCPVRLRQRLYLDIPAHVSLRIEDYGDVAAEVARVLHAAGDGVRSPRAFDKPLVSVSNDTGPHGSNVGLPVSPSRPRPLEHAACIEWEVEIGVPPQDASSDHRITYHVAYDDETEARASASVSSTRRIALPWGAKPQGGRPAQIARAIANQLAETFQLPYRDVQSVQQPAPPGEDDEERAAASLDEQARVAHAETDKRQVPYTKRIRLVLSLVNENMAATPVDSSQAVDGDTYRQAMVGVEDWNAAEVEKAFAHHIGPLLTSLQDTHTFTIEMQTVWFAPLQFRPKLIELPRIEQSPIADASLAAAAADEDDERDETTAMEDGVADDAADALLGAVTRGGHEQSPKRTQKMHVINWNDLQIFVHAGEWGLSTGGPIAATNVSHHGGTAEDDLGSMQFDHERTLNFVLYVPEPAHRPLRIAGDAEATTVSPASGWLIPQWGGVSLYNLGHGEAASQVARSSDDRIALDSLNADELEPAFATFEKQLRSLLGVKQVSHAASLASLFLQAQELFALDALLRQRILEVSRESVQTLASIVRLVDKIKVLSVDQSVRSDVAAALRLLEDAEALMAYGESDMASRKDTLSEGDLQAPNYAKTSSNTLDSSTPLALLSHLLELSYNSALYASRAFFNPRMLGQLYFPDEHKYAVYTPLFGPLAVPLLVAGLRLLKERRRQRRSVALLSDGAADQLRSSASAPRK